MRCRYWRLPQYVPDQYIQGYYNRRQSQSQVEYICSDWWQLPLQTDSPQLQKVLLCFTLLWLLVDRTDWSTHFTTASVWKLLCACSAWAVTSEVMGVFISCMKPEKDCSVSPGNIWRFISQLKFCFDIMSNPLFLFAGPCYCSLIWQLSVISSQMLRSSASVGIVVFRVLPQIKLRCFSFTTYSSQVNSVETS